jgi:uroporphyrinogen decarboxylase
MTHREKILCALAHKEPDRIPVDLGGTESSGITGIAYHRLKTHLGIRDGKIRIFDLMQQIAKVEPSVLRRIGADAVPLLIEPKEWKPSTLPDGIPCEIPHKVIIETRSNGDMVVLSKNNTPLMKRPAGGYYFDSIYHPLEFVREEKEIDAEAKIFDSSDWPSWNDESFFDIADKAKRLHTETEYAVVGNLWVHLLAAGQDLRGYENFMVDILVNKKLAHRLLERQLASYLPRIENYIEAVGAYVDIIQVNDDLGIQNGPVLSPSLYREMVKPYHKTLWDFIKKKSKKPLLLHSCGSVYELIPDIIECGIDALNPVQVSARNMGTAKLKREFGKDLTFWGGGCDTQEVLPHGTVQDVKDEVMRRVGDLAHDGGFVFCQVHNIQPDVPPQNIEAMYEALGTLA